MSSVEQHVTGNLAIPHAPESVERLLGLGANVIIASDMADPAEIQVPERLSDLIRLAAAHQMGIELQLERHPLTAIPATQDELGHLPVLGVHMPIQDKSVYADEAKMRAALKEQFTWMRDNNADYFVMHLEAEDHWDLEHREKRIADAKTLLTLIKEEYEAVGGNFTIFIENLEYPKYPATADEIIDVMHYTQTQGAAFAFLFDVGHMWRSGYLQHENLNRKPHEHLKPDRWGSMEVDFPTHLQYFLQRLQREGIPLDIVHITGCVDTKTHETLFTPAAPGLPYLDLTQAYAIIRRLFPDVTVVNESHGQRREDAITDVQRMRYTDEQRESTH